MKFLDTLSWQILLILCVVPGLTPFIPKPHIVEKIAMLTQGTLTRPLDIFDLFFHGAPFMLLGLKLLRTLQKRKQV